MRVSWPTAPRSSSHHGCSALLVCVTEPWKNIPPALPSTARRAAPFQVVLDCVALLLRTRLTSVEVNAGMPTDEKRLCEGQDDSAMASSCQKISGTPALPLQKRTTAVPSVRCHMLVQTPGMPPPCVYM